MSVAVPEGYRRLRHGEQLLSTDFIYWKAGKSIEPCADKPQWFVNGNPTLGSSTRWVYHEDNSYWVPIRKAEQPLPDGWVLFSERKPTKADEYNGYVDVVFNDGSRSNFRYDTDFLGRGYAWRRLAPPPLPEQLIEVTTTTGKRPVQVHRGGSVTCNGVTLSNLEFDRIAARRKEIMRSDS